MRKTIILIGVALLFLCIAGCSNWGSEGRITPIETPENTTTGELSPIVPTNTSSPEVFSPSVTPQSEASAKAEYLAFLSTNDGCPLPCIWGVTPGISTVQDMETTLVSLANTSGLSGFSITGGFSDFHYTNMGYDLLTYVAYTSDSSNKGIVNEINITIQELDTKTFSPSFGHSFESNTFSQQIYPYTLSGVLTAKGKPETVLVSTYGSDEDLSLWQFIILLIYPEDGIVAQYTTRLQINGEMVVGCPEDAHVNMELFPEGDSSQFAQLLARTSWAGLWPPSETSQPGWLPIDQATDMTIEEFYELFLNQTDACISTPADLWNWSADN